MAHDDAKLARQFRPRIETELDELLALSRASSDDRLPVTLDQQRVGRLARMDAMQLQAMAQAAERRRNARILGLRKALSRLEDGEYGYCENCGEPIALERLDVDITATRCVGCARLSES